MKCLKVLGWLVPAAIASTAFAGNAMADQLTSPTGTTSTPTISAQSEGHSVTDNRIATVECDSAYTFTIESHGAGKNPVGKVSSMNTSNCTNDWHVTVVSAGSLEIEATSGYNGTLYSMGLTVEKTRFGVNCRYTTNTTHIGTVTGGSPATIHVQGSLPLHSGSFLCGSGAVLITGAYTVTSPGSLYVDNS